MCVMSRVKQVCVPREHVWRGLLNLCAAAFSPLIWFDGALLSATVFLNIFCTGMKIKLQQLKLKFELNYIKVRRDSSKLKLQ